MADDATINFDAQEQAAGEEPVETQAARITPRHQAALNLAAGGIPIFPCVLGGKVPAVAGSFKAATTDLAQVDAWWAEADYNVAFCPEDAGLCVIDVDNEETWAGLEIEHGDTPTYAVATPSGGRHLHYRGSLPPSVSKLGPGVDTRGKGSYVLCPPSVVAGKAYVVAEARAYAPVPDWISATLSRQREPLPAPEIEQDAAENVSRARSYLERHPAEEGNRNDTAFRNAAMLRDLGISQQTTFDMLTDEWRCEPPLDPEELGRTVASAYRPRPGQNEAGAYAVRPFSPAVARFIGIPVQEGGGGSEDRSDYGAMTPKKANRFTLLDEAAQDALPEPEWLVAGFIVDRSTHAIHAPYNALKSFIATDVALAVASGEKAFGRLATCRTGPVIYAMGEGVTGFSKKRRQAWRTHRKIAPARKLPIYVIKGVPHVGSEVDVADFIAAIDTRLPQGEKPALVIFDPASRSMKGLKESDAGDAGLYIDMIEAVADRYGCATLTVIHEGKEREKGARGSSVFTDDIENVWKVEGDAKALTAKIEVDRLKDEADIGAIHLKAREITLADGKTSLVVDWVGEDDYRAANAVAGTGTAGVTRSECGAALIALGAASPGEDFTTHVLASEIALRREGDGRPDTDMGNITRDLSRKAKNLLRPYVMHQAQGRGDVTKWAHRPGVMSD